MLLTQRGGLKFLLLHVPSQCHFAVVREIHWCLFSDKKVNLSYRGSNLIDRLSIYSYMKNKLYKTIALFRE